MREGGVENKGPLAWFARNAVAANVVMIILLAGGLISVGNIQQEVFPDVEVDMVVIEIAYPGASPEEVEQGVLSVTEEAVRGLTGVRSVESVADEGVGIVRVEVILGADADRVATDVENAVARIATYPDDAETPSVSLVAFRMLAVSIAIFGPDDEEVLRRYAQRLRSLLLEDERVTLVELRAVRPREIAISIPAAELWRHGVTLEQVARQVRASTLTLPAGDVDTPAGEIMVRTEERVEYGSDLEDVPVLASPEGVIARVADLGDVADGFEDTGLAAFVDGNRAVLANVMRVGDQTPNEVAAAAREAVRALENELPEAMGVMILQDTSVLFSDRVRLLVRNGLIGLLLILLILGVFLELKLAFWVMVGLAVSFIGALLFLPALDVSLNVVSIFAFIIALGLVIDDAIVVGEAVYRHRQEGMETLAAAIAGVREMVLPVTFAVLTTALAFLPLLLVSGFAGRIYANIPLIVLPVLAISLVEAFFILPAHLGHSRPLTTRGVLGWVTRNQEKVGGWLQHFIDNQYCSAVRWAVRNRYLTLSFFVSLLIISAAMVAGGRLGFIFMPDIESDTSAALLEFPFGSPQQETLRGMELLENEARAVLEDNGWKEFHRATFSQVGALTFTGGMPGTGARPETGGHLAEVAVELVPAGERPFSAEDFNRLWRRRVGEIPGAVRLAYFHQAAGMGQRAVAFDLSHPDESALMEAARVLADRLECFVGLYDVDAGLARGKEQIDLELLPSGRMLGLTSAEMAQQVRAAVFGAEALRQQRDRDEVRVMVRLPEGERTSRWDVENLPILTPQGGWVPLRHVARLTECESPARILRRDGRRIIQVSADIDRDIQHCQTT